MKIIRNKVNTTFQFRINEQSGSEGDETQKYFTFVNKLVKEFIPFSTSRFAFISRESDDCIWGVMVNNLYADTDEFRNELCKMKWGNK